MILLTQSLLSQLSLSALLCIGPSSTDNSPTVPSPRGNSFDQAVAVELALRDLRAHGSPFSPATPGFAEFSVGLNGTVTPCTIAAESARQSELADARADLLLGLGKCISAGDHFLRCFMELMAEHHQSNALAHSRYHARLAVCRELNEQFYAPDLDPTNFTSHITNQWFPQVIGRRLIYRSVGDEIERIRVTALDETYEIEGIECRVVRDTVTVDGELLEDTFDWYAQHTSGDLWYIGEIALNYEDGQVADVGGSWKTGVDGAQPGILLKANPQIGDVYRQEFLLGEAKDMARVVGLDETVTVTAGTFTGCLKTEEFTPMEPGMVEIKYFAPGVGFVLGINPDTGERVELIRIIDPQ